MGLAVSFSSKWKHLCSNCSPYFSYSSFFLLSLTEVSYRSPNIWAKGGALLCDTTNLDFTQGGDLGTQGYYRTCSSKCQYKLFPPQEDNIWGAEWFFCSFPSGKWWDELKPPHFSDYIYIYIYICIYIACIIQTLVYCHEYVIFNILYYCNYITTVSY